MPKVSVLIPFYNSAAFLGPCIESVLQQTYKDFELILLNDGSTDNSEQIAEAYDDPRIRYYANEKNLGIPISHNKLTDLATGEYMALVDSDNLCLPERLEKQVAYLDNHPDVTIVGSWGKLFNAMPANSLYAKLKKAFINLGWVWCQPENVTIEETLRGNTCMHSSMMIRKSDFIKADIRYNPSFAVAEDYDLLRQTLVAGLKIRNIQEVLFKYQLHGENISITKKQLMKEADARVKEDIRRFLKIDNARPYPYWLIILRKLRPDVLLKLMGGK